jgi:hypothetical protein
MYRPCRTYSDQSKCVSELGDACRASRAKFGYPPEDARSVALDNILGLSQSAQMVLNLLDSWTRGDNLVRQVIPQLVGLTTVTTEGVNIAAGGLNQTNKVALSVLGQFQVENVLRNVSAGLGLPAAGIGFYRMASHLLVALGRPADEMLILNTPARLRNSLHTNGIYHRQHPSEQEVVVIGGVTYEFHDGQPVRCATWEHIAHALEASVGVLGNIFSEPRVRALPHPLFDHYAWDTATDPGGGS